MRAVRERPEASEPFPAIAAGPPGVVGAPAPACAEALEAAASLRRLREHPQLLHSGASGRAEMERNAAR